LGRWAAVMERGEAPAEREPDSRSGLAREDLRATVEDLEDRDLQLVGDSWPPIVHAEQQILAVALEPRLDRGAWRGVLDGVREKVLDDPLELIRVDVRHERLGIHLHRMLARLEERRDLLEEECYI